AQRAAKRLPDAAAGVRRTAASTTPSAPDRWRAANNGRDYRAVREVRDDTVTPVVVLREHPRAHGQRPEKRKKNQPEQDSQSRFAMKHLRRLARNQMPRNLSADLACHRRIARP